MVLITALDGETRKEVESLGGVYIPKPFLLEDLLQIINRRLRMGEL
jgi:hypothetical protein